MRRDIFARFHRDSEAWLKMPLRFFSWTFLMRSTCLALKYPSTLLALLSGTDVRVSIHELRKTEWATLKQIYKDRPMRVLGFQIYLNPLDLSPVSTSIATSGWLNLPLTALIKKVLKPGMTLVDVVLTLATSRFSRPKLLRTATYMRLNLSRLISIYYQNPF